VAFAMAVVIFHQRPLGWATAGVPVTARNDLIGLYGLGVEIRSLCEVHWRTVGSTWAGVCVRWWRREGARERVITVMRGGAQ